MKPPIPVQKKQALAEELSQPHDWGGGQYYADPRQAYIEGAAALRTPKDYHSFRNNYYQGQGISAGEYEEVLAQPGTERYEAIKKTMEATLGDNPSALHRLGVLADPRKYTYADIPENRKESLMSAGWVNPRTDEGMIASQSTFGGPEHGGVHEPMHKGARLIRKDAKYGKVFKYVVPDKTSHSVIDPVTATIVKPADFDKQEDLKAYMKHKQEVRPFYYDLAGLAKEKGFDEVIGDARDVIQKNVKDDGTFDKDAIKKFYDAKDMGTWSQISTHSKRRKQIKRAALAEAIAQLKIAKDKPRGAR